MMHQYYLRSSILRVSPDHGPNEKMLGKNLSNPQSLIKAISFLDKQK